jgi:Phosphoenolpyruvate synthase/pyruvate phosphate dikinase
MGSLRYLDDHNFWLDQPLYGAFRLVYIYIGKKLKEREIIEDEEQIFFLYSDELDRILRGRTVETDKNYYNKLSLQRQKYYEFWSKQNVKRKINYKNSERHINEEHLSGIPVSPGIVSGRALVWDSHSPDKIIKGDILVCSTFSPSFLPYIKHVSGIIAAGGNVLCHGAIIAREYGIPAIFGVENIVHKLHTGMQIQINGGDGTIRMYSKPSENELNNERIVYGAKEFQYISDRNKKWHILSCSKKIYLPFEASVIALLLDPTYEYRLFEGRWFSSRKEAGFRLQQIEIDNLSEIRTSVSIVQIWNRIIKGYSTNKKICNNSDMPKDIGKLMEKTINNVCDKIEISKRLVNYLYLNEIISILNGDDNNNFTALVSLREDIYKRF